MAYVLATDALCVLRTKGLVRWIQAGWLLQAGRVLLFVGVPYLALGGWPRPSLSALLVPQDIGFIGWDPRWPAARWLEAMGDALGLAIVSLAILLLAWVNANRLSGQGAVGFGVRIPPAPWWSVAVDILVLEVHWAFYRGAMALIFEDLYTGVFAGLGLAYLEWFLSALWWRNWSGGSQAESGAALQWLRSALVLVSALVFLVTQSLWACLLAHGLIELTLRRVSGRRRGFWLSSAPNADVSN